VAAIRRAEHWQGIVLIALAIPGSKNHEGSKNLDSATLLEMSGYAGG